MVRHPTAHSPAAPDMLAPLSSHATPLTHRCPADLLALLAEYCYRNCVSSCAGGGGGGGDAGGGAGGGFDSSVCSRAPPETYYHWDGPGGPLGDTGLLGWTPIAHHVGSGAEDAP